MTSISLQHFLILSFILFSLGTYAVIVRKNILVALIGIELILNAANLNFFAFSKFKNYQFGELAIIFVIIIAASEAAVALAIFINLYRNFASINPDKANTMKE